jgi:hypothetical protein
MFTAMLDMEHTYYRKNREKLMKTYPDKYIVIVRKHVIGAFGSHTEAYEAARKEYEVGMFIIKHLRKVVME